LQKKRLLTEAQIKPDDKKKIISVLTKVKGLSKSKDPDSSKTIRFLIGSLIGGGVAMSAILLLAAKMFGAPVFDAISRSLADAIEIEHIRNYYHTTPVR